MMLSSVGVAWASVPVDPDAPTAQDWLVGELAKPEYQAAKPSWFDLASKAVQDWFSSLFGGTAGSFSPALLVVIVVIALVVVAIVFIVYGLPRINRRSRADRGTILGLDDTRDATTVRAAAERAARAGDWTLAVEERFRALAQGLDERTIVLLTPGTTANEFATRAGLAAPPLRDRLVAAARVFDGVRYLDRTGSAMQYDELTALDLAAQQVRPEVFDVTAGTAR